MTNPAIVRGNKTITKTYLCDCVTTFSNAIREIAFLSSFDNPYICKLNSWNYSLDSDSKLYISLVLPLGNDISKCECNIKNVAKAILLAQVALHENGIAQHDIKPDNLIWLDGNVKVIDFDIAEQCNAFTMENGYAFREAPGYTEGYSDPEYLPDEYNSIKQDLYATAITIYQLITGTRSKQLYNFTTGTDIDLLLNDLIAPVKDRKCAAELIIKHFDEIPVNYQRLMPIPTSRKDLSFISLNDSENVETAFLALYLYRCCDNLIFENVLDLARIMTNVKINKIDVGILEALKSLKGLCWSTTPWNYARSINELPALLAQLTSSNFDMRNIGCMKERDDTDKRITMGALRNIPLIELSDINNSEELILISDSNYILPISDYIEEGDPKLLLAVALRTSLASIFTSEDPSVIQRLH